jgi:hypothetical protein
MPHIILKAALFLHGLGLSVVPCDGKKPVVKGWPTKRLTEEELREHLSDGELNIAVALNQSDWIDIECDSKEAEKKLRKLFGGKMPRTPTYRSKRGKHFIFLRPPGLPHKAVIVIDGIEFRIGNGKGVLSIFPPSVHESGVRYRWIKGLKLFDDLMPTELPPNFVEMLQNSGETESGLSDGGSIEEGRRNDALFKKGCALNELKLPESAIAATLLDLNENFCEPPLPESEVRAIAHSVAGRSAVSKTGFINQLLESVELWHDEDGTPYATIPLGVHQENWRVGKKSAQFVRWLSRLWFDATQKTIPSQAVDELLSLLSARAVFDGPEHQLFRRVAAHGQAFYLDLCDPEWRAIEIDAAGFRVLLVPPVKFRRAKAMLPLPEPEPAKGSELAELLLPFLNLKPEDWPLVAVWLVAALRPTGPYPLLKLLGEQGSAKTTTARLLRLLIDPNSAPVRAEPKTTRDLAITANHQWILCFDNLSSVSTELSDALCRMSTGGGFAIRSLYTDDDETIFDAVRPVILTSIEEIGVRSDLLERSLVIELPTIDPSSRRAEKQFWADFEEAHPQILGALLDAVSGAIRRLPEIEKNLPQELPRLADFHVWGLAAEESLGLQPGTFSEAYVANRESATQIILESSPVIGALRKFLRKNGPLEMTATELLRSLNAMAGFAETRKPGWPKTPNLLSTILQRSAPNLREIGIKIQKGNKGSGNGKRKVWRISDPIDPSTRKRVKKKLRLGQKPTSKPKSSRKRRRND